LLIWLNAELRARRLRSEIAQAHLDAKAAMEQAFKDQASVMCCLRVAQGVDLLCQA
jgi:hypothetical protein